MQHQSSRDWFDYVRREVTELATMEGELAAMRETAGCKAQRLDSVGHGSGNADASGVVLAIARLSTEVDSRRVRVNRLLERATVILYGDHGRGGLARAKGYATADCLCGYYLQGMTWQQVADEMVRPDSKDGAQWCRTRARAAFQHIDAGRIGDVIPNP